VYKQWQAKYKNETNMNKLNNGAKMKVSAKNPATAHTLDRWQP